MNLSPGPVDRGAGVAYRAAGLEDFGHDPWWLVLVKIVVVFAFLVVMTLFAIWFERRVVARMQVRPGPNRAGPFGLLQSLADGLKLAFKEDLMPKMADKVVFFFAPVISATCAFTAFSVIPFGPNVSVFGHTTPLQLTDIPVAVLLVLACSSMGVYGVVLAGWASGSTYPLLGSLRSSAQMISYEVAMGLSIVAVFMNSGSMSTSEIVDAQAGAKDLTLFGVDVPVPGWYAVLLLPSFLIYFTSAVGETNRAPFDLPEAESELVGGFHTEYSSLKFAMFFLAEYINMVTVSALCTTLFLGGWRAPWPLTVWSGANHGWLPVVWFTGKLLLVLFVFVWLRGTLPRLRYDQFMRLGWKVLIPANLVWILVLAGIRVLQTEDLANSTRYMIISGPALVALLIVLLWPGGKAETGAKGAAEKDGTEAGDVVADDVTSVEALGRIGGAEGFPLPPMDLRVPVSPRATRIAVERPDGTAAAIEPPAGVGAAAERGEG